MEPSGWTPGDRQTSQVQRLTQSPLRVFGSSPGHAAHLTRLQRAHVSSVQPVPVPASIQTHTYYYGWVNCESIAARASTTLPPIVPFALTRTAATTGGERSFLLRPLYRAATSVLAAAPWIAIKVPRGR